MNKTILLGALTVAGLAAGAAAAGTMDDVKARGTLKCGVSTGLAGFSAPNANGVWEGFDVAVCRAVAAAVRCCNRLAVFAAEVHLSSCLSANSGLARSFSVLYAAGSRYGESGTTYLNTTRVASECFSFKASVSCLSQKS